MPVPPRASSELPTQLTSLVASQLKNISLGCDNLNPGVNASQDLRADVLLSGNGFVTPQLFGAPVNGIDNDSAGFQAAINSQKPVLLPPGTYVIDTALEIDTNTKIIGAGSFGTLFAKLIHKAGATGPMFRRKPSVARPNSVYLGNFYMQGNNEAGETYGIDSTGLTYALFENLWMGASANQGFRLANFYNNAQAANASLNNVLINCRFNNSGAGAGMLFDVNADNCVATTILGGESAGNQGRGLDIRNGASYWIFGLVVQQDTLAAPDRDVFIDNVHSSFIRLYYEPFSTGGTGTIHGGRGIELSANSNRIDIAARGTFSMASTFLDLGKRNKVSNFGEGNGKHYFSNPYALGWRGNLPDNIRDENTQNLTFVSFTDAESRGIEITVSNNAFTWMSLTLNRWYANNSALKDDLANTWVTLVLDMDTTLFPASAEMRVYSQLNGTVIGSANELHIFNKPTNFIGRKFADVRFSAGGAGPLNATHSGASSTTVLNVSPSPSYTPNAFIGWKVVNTTDGSNGLVISNTASTVTVDQLIAGTENDFDDGDLCILAPPGQIRFSPSWNATTGTNKLRIRGMWVVDGQTCYRGNWPGRKDFVETLTNLSGQPSTRGASRIDSTNGAVTGTLPNGTYVGQKKTFVMVNAANSSTITVTNHQTSNPEVFTFNAVNQALVLEWTGNQWVTIFNTAIT